MASRVSRPRLLGRRLPSSALRCWSAAGRRRTPGHLHQPGQRILRRHLRRPGGDPGQGRLVVRLLHRRPAAGRRPRPDHAHRPDPGLGRLGLPGHGLQRCQPAGVRRTGCRAVGPGHPLRRRSLRALLHGHRHHAERGRRLGHRRRDRTLPDRAVDAGRRAGGRPAAGQRRLPVDLRPGDVHRCGRAALPLLRLLQRRAVGADAGRRRAEHGRRRDHGGDRQPLRGQLRGSARRLVLPDGVGRQLLRRARPPATRCSAGARARRWGRSSTPTGSRCWPRRSAAP